MPETLEDRTPDCEAMRQMKIISSGAFEILPPEDLGPRIQVSLDEGRPLRVKLGADPSAPDLHVGHMVAIRKLRQFQDLGHQVIFIIGDFTAMIGDPSGRSETRKRLSAEEVRENAKTYFDQVYTVLDPARTEVVYNSQWLGMLQFADIIELASRYTVARMLERDDFDKRFKDEEPIYVHEFLYPLMQAYDSVAVRADIEIGGTDQKFNLLLGREIQREMGQPPQVILTLPLLVGTDGVRKMSKSLGNYIGISEPAREIYGKTMSLPDESMGDYLRLALGYSGEAAEGLEKQVAAGTLHPRDLKARIAYELTAVFRGEAAAAEAQAQFDQVFRDRKAPNEMPEVSMTIPPGEETLWVVPALVQAGLCESNRQARKAIAAGGVRINGERVADEADRLAAGEFTVQVGKRAFRKVRLTRQ
jgi:tyrosyl-tRNA synthetase